MRIAQALPLALHGRQHHLAIPAEQLGEGGAVLRQEVDQVPGIVLTVALDGVLIWRAMLG